MESLSEGEIAEIAGLQREEGARRLACLFSWTEFDDRRCGLQQEFVHDVVAFAASRGFSRDSVIRAARAAKSIFPQLHDLDADRLVSLFRDVLPGLTPVQQSQLVRYLAHTLVSRRRLLAAVAVGGAPSVTIKSLEVGVELPPAPCPLEEGTDLHEWEAQRHEDGLGSELEQKQEELRRLRDGPRVSLKDVDVPSDQGAAEFVREAVRSAGGQILENLNREVHLMGDIQELTRQRQAATTSRGRQSDSPQAKQQTAKTRKQ
ncbi:uncharacterized protein C8orf74 homolog [Salarias fasciatus]|uniref:uncharacterized protein C8orf74 homolog n=1 Tax=Salarias fasciatus TaxID=181472 RepID=UPI0011770A65|nr:uncharacterized protein C8orf74 homolog [Salarias fasciatus]